MHPCCSVHETEVVRAIERRIAGWTHLPILHGEPMEVGGRED